MKGQVDEFFALAARIFGVSPGSLTLSTRYGDLPGWDSIGHLRLVMEAEKLFGVVYDLEEMPAMRTLADFIDRARAHKES